MIIAPLHFAVLAPFFGGGDVAAAAAVDWPRWPAHVLAGLVLLFNLRLVVKLCREGKAQPESCFETPLDGGLCAGGWHGSAGRPGGGAGERELSGAARLPDPARMWVSNMRQAAKVG